jgi:hypothetical protein
MRRLCAIAFALLFGLLSGSGCASEDGKGQWDEFWKDLRGDNMQMGSHDQKPP